MNIAQFLHEFVISEDVEIVVVGLPERPFRAAHGNGQLERLNRLGQWGALRLAEQEMHMLRHDDVACDRKAISQPDTLQRVLEEIHGRFRREVRPAAITAECQEVEVSGLLITQPMALHAVEDTPLEDEL